MNSCYMLIRDLIELCRYNILGNLFTYYIHGLYLADLGSCRLDIITKTWEILGMLPWQIYHAWQSHAQTSFTPLHGLPPVPETIQLCLCDALGKLNSTVK